MATVQELESAIADLKAAADQQKAQIADKLKDLSDKLEAAQIPDTALSDLQATTQEIKDLVNSPPQSSFDVVAVPPVVAPPSVPGVTPVVPLSTTPVTSTPINPQ